MQFPQAFTLDTIAKLIDSEYAGNPEMKITGLNEIHMVEPGDITFVDHSKYYAKALNSKATTIIINSKVECPEGKSLIFNDDPFAAYVTLVKKFKGFEPCSSLISPSAKIGQNTIIQPGAFIGNNVIIGNNCIIHANASIYDNTIVGNDVIIHSGAVIGADAYYFQRRPQGYRKLESCGRVVLKDRVEIGALSAIDKGVSGDTTIDEGTKMDNHVQVGHDTYIGKNCLIGSHSAIAGVTKIEDDVILWGRVSVNKDLVVGKGAIVLATSSVDKTLEGGGKTYFGTPTEEVRKYWKNQVFVKKLPELFDALRAKGFNI